MDIYTCSIRLSMFRSLRAFFRSVCAAYTNDCIILSGRIKGADCVTNVSICKLGYKCDANMCHNPYIVAVDLKWLWVS